MRSGKPDLFAALIDSVWRNPGPRSQRRQFAFCAAALAVAVVLARCAGPPGPDPAAAARKYLVALKSGDYQTCYGMLTEHDLAHGSLGDFLAGIPLAPEVDQRWFKPIEAVTDYSVGPAERHDDLVILPVRITTPNLVLWERMLGGADQNRKTIQDKAQKQLDDRTFPRLDYEDRMVMALEGDEWRVLAGFETRAQIRALHNQALAAYHLLDYAKALGLYRKMVERLGHSEFTGRNELAQRLSVEMKRVEAASGTGLAAQAYIPHLVLKNVATKPALSGSPGMFGEMVNSGDRALDQVNLTVSYYTPGGKLIYTERHTPFALPLRFADFDLPLVPFAPGSTRKFGIALRAPMDVQQQSKAVVNVSGVILSQAPGPAKTGAIAQAAADSAKVPDPRPAK